MLHISIDHCPSRLDWRNRGTPLQITPNGQVIWQVTVHEGATGQAGSLHHKEFPPFGLCQNREGVAIIPGVAVITLNWKQITPFDSGAAGYFYGTFHRRQSRRLCAESLHGHVARKNCHTEPR